MTTKLSYFEMIEDAILGLAERKGSTRQAIWKFISYKHPEADYKQYLIRLKKVKDNSNIEAVGTQRFKLSANYRHKLLKALKKGEPTKAVQKSKATMKKSGKRKAAKAKTAKRASSKKSSSKGGVKRASGKGKAAKGKKMTKRGSKTAAGKKTSGSKKTQQKKSTKKSMNQKKKSMNKARNTKKGGMAKKGGKAAKGKAASAASKRKTAKTQEQHDAADQGGQDHNDKAASPRMSSRR